MAIEAELKRRLEPSGVVAAWPLHDPDATQGETLATESVRDAGARARLQAIVDKLSATLAVGGRVELGPEALAALEAISVTITGPVTLADVDMATQTTLELVRLLVASVDGKVGMLGTELTLAGIRAELETRLPAELADGRLKTSITGSVDVGQVRLAREGSYRPYSIANGLVDLTLEDVHSSYQTADIYKGAAVRGAAINTPVFDVIRTRLDADGYPARKQYRAGVRWDLAIAGDAGIWGA